MEIEELKKWIIDLVNKTTDIDKLNEIKSVLSFKRKNLNYASSLGDDFQILNELDSSVKFTKHENEKLILTKEQEHELLEELKSAEEDLKNGRVFSSEEVQAYFKLKMALSEK
jgi:argininosuccinate lyase